MSNNYYQGDYAPQGGTAPKQKKEKINQWEGTGIVSARGRNQEIKFFQFQQGGGAIHINVYCTEFTGTSDQNGNPKTTNCYVPVEVYTNKNINEQMLRAVIPGMKVHVVGRLAVESYEDRSGQKRSSIVVKAFVFEILQMPMQMPQAGAYMPQGGYQGQQMPQYQQPQAPPQYQGQQYPPQGGYQGQQMPQYQQPQAPPQYQGQQYSPQPAPAPQMQQYNPQAPQPQQGQQMPQPTKPAYYAPPAPGTHVPPVPKAEDDDLPPA